MKTITTTLIWKMNMKNGLMIWLILVMMPLTATAKTYFVHPDQLGTPQVITDQNQQVVWSADYDPFGEANITTETITNNLRFPGQYFDQETNLHYNYFRDYDPSTGRYIESDPVGLQGGLNTYSYALQNSIKYIDPDGQIAQAIGVVGIGVAIGVTAVVISNSSSTTGDGNGKLIPTVGVPDPLPKLAPKPSCDLIYSLCMKGCTKDCDKASWGKRTMIKTSCFTLCSFVYLTCKLDPTDFYDF